MAVTTERGETGSRGTDLEWLQENFTLPGIIRIAEGHDNYISTNHIAALTEAAEESKEAQDSCYSAQVEAMLSTARAQEIRVTAVKIEPESTHNIVLDTGTEAQVRLDREKNAFRPLPAPWTDE